MNKTKKLSSTQANKEIENIFSQEKISATDIKKIKKIATSKNIKLGIIRKKFCKKCLSYFTVENAQIRIKNGMKIISCKKCGTVSRWKMQ